MLGLDTNVLVRFLVRDHEAQGHGHFRCEGGQIARLRGWMT
jgi:predicted nucleic-acid-binding protein